MGQCQGLEVISLSLGFRPLLPYKDAPSVNKWFLGMIFLSQCNWVLFFLTLIMTIWDSSRISRKLGFRTDKLMLGTTRKHTHTHIIVVVERPEVAPITEVQRCCLYVSDWYGPRCSTESLASPSNRDYRSPPPVPSPCKESNFDLWPCVLHQSTIRSDRKRIYHLGRVLPEE